MNSFEHADRRWRLLVLAPFLAIAVAACSDDDDDNKGSGPTQASFETTRLCALVDARDPADAAFPPAPPVRAFGTDLGWTYEHDGEVTILFGDTWQRIDICPLQINDDSLATMERPADDWPGFTATDSIPEEECPELTFAVDAAGTAFAPIELRRPNGVLIPLGPLNTPVTGFSDGEKEWTIFLVGGGQPCSAEDATNGAPCPSDFSPQAADLVCGFAGTAPTCLDPTSTKEGAGSQALFLHIAERVGPSSFVSRADFLTNKYLNLTARTVRAFDPDDPHRSDYGPGNGALLMWGRPGFDDLEHDGEAPPYFMVHSLPFEFDGDHIDFQPRYLSGGLDGESPTFGSSQAGAIPLYTGEFEPVNHAAVSYLEDLSRWIMIYGGYVVDFVNVENNAGASQPVRGAVHARLAPDAWGPWTDPQPILTEEEIAEDFVCGKAAPAGCLTPPSPLIRPACIEFVDPRGGGALYGANIIDFMTRPAQSSGRGRAVDVFWDVSTWHPYSVVLVKSRIELE